MAGVGQLVGQLAPDADDDDDDSGGEEYGQPASWNSSQLIAHRHVCSHAWAGGG